MSRESSAGGVVVRERDGTVELAVIQPRGRDVWALPKGHMDAGETLEQAAAREVLEETGLRVQLEAPLGEIRYVYQFRGQKIFKQVHFFLYRYLEGEIDRIDPKMRLEVARARWIPLADAPAILAYRGEREMALKAAALLRAEQPSR
jgi:8-oxo-dGTP pyrophosphatase MutT (NUDIX family)